MSIASGYGPNWTTAESWGLDAQRRVVELEQQLAAAQAEVRELRERAEKAERNYQWMVERAADQHLSGYRELARRAADAENVADGLRAELERVRELAAKWRAAPQNPDEPLLAMAADELEAALSQPAEQHDPLAVSDHCPECSEPEPECVCGEQPDERESLPLMTRDTCTNCGGTGVGGYHFHAPQEDAVEALRCEACDGLGFIEHGPKDCPATAPELPLMARRPRHNDDDLGELYENGKRLCTISGGPPLREPMPGFVLYRIADTDEHGFKVIPRTADMPKQAKYRISYTARAGVYYTGIPQLALEASRSGAVSERIEDYRESGKEG